LILIIAVYMLLPFLH